MYVVLIHKKLHIALTASYYDMRYFVIPTVVQNDPKQKQNIKIRCIITFLYRQFFAPQFLILFIMVFVFHKNHI